MMTPVVFLALVLLGHTHASAIKSQTNDTSKQSFFIGAETGFEVKENAVCYDQEVESTVHVIIADKTKWEIVQFMVGQETEAEFTIDELEAKKLKATPVGQVQKNGADKNKIDKNALTFPFLPTSMKLIHKNGQSSVQDTSITVTDKCPAETTPAQKTDPPAGCIAISKTKYLVGVETEVTSVTQVLILDGGDGKKIRTTFCLCSGTPWVSHSVAAILASVAVMNLA